MFKTLILFFFLSAIVYANEQPVKALVILGGEHHKYEEGSKLVCDHLKTKMNIEFHFVRIDNPPKGLPRAEKAKVPSNPKTLEDWDLNKKFDLIIAYNQEAYTNLTPKQRDGYLHFVRSGGPWVGIHSAGDFLKKCPDYVKMVGGKFLTHPPFCDLKIQCVAGDHFITQGMSDFEIKDEFYHMSDCSLQDKHILMVGKSPKGGHTRPVAWTKTYGKGKVFYTVLGHAPISFQNPNLLNLLHRAVLWAIKPEVGQEGKDGWISLFNGKDRTGWTQCGPGFMAIEDNAFKTIDGMGLLWFHKRKFKDFVLSLEYKVSRKNDNSGIFIRFPNPPRDEWQPVHEGYEIQICDGANPLHGTGAIYSFKAASKIPSKPVGQWNLMEIMVKGQNYTVSLNNEKITEYVGERGEDGYIGLQNHDKNSIVYYRNIRVKEM